jgi:hypothetical protein
LRTEKRSGASLSRGTLTLLAQPERAQPFSRGLDLPRLAAGGGICPLVVSAPVILEELDRPRHGATPYSDPVSFRGPCPVGLTTIPDSSSSCRSSAPNCLTRIVKHRDPAEAGSRVVRLSYTRTRPEGWRARTASLPTLPLRARVAPSSSRAATQERAGRPAWARLRGRPRCRGSRDLRSRAPRRRGAAARRSRRASAG